MSCLMVKNLIFGSAFVSMSAFWYSPLTNSTCMSSLSTHSLMKCLLSNLFNHNACVAAAVAAMNSDSHDDNATVACFCVLQLIGDSP
ncbi:hypothetical protein Tco_1478901 [Tanacetum coccineum]